MSSVSANLSLLRRFVTVKPHVPMIRFRKGGDVRAGEASCGSAAVEASQPSAPAGTEYRGHRSDLDLDFCSGPAVYEWWEVPGRFRREVVDQQECDVINMGGDGKLWS